MESVRAWAKHRGADYRCLDDEEFFAGVPPWLFDLKWIQPATDLARLLVARRLHEGFRCSIWMDSDVLVFEPRRLALPVPHRDAAFAREVWMTRRKGRLSCRENVSNYACSFKRGSRTLDEYIEGCLKPPSTLPTKAYFLGPMYLTQRHSKEKLELVDHIGSLSPTVILGLMQQDVSVLDTYRRGLGTSLYAANLCMSFEAVGRVSRPDHDALVTALVEDGGRLFGATKTSILRRFAGRG